MKSRKEVNLVRVNPLPVVADVNGYVVGFHVTLNADCEVVPLLDKAY